MNTDSRTARGDLIRKVFQERFHGEPELWARAPGRVDLMGSHTDYNRGYVLTLPISRDTWIAARPVDDGTVHIYSSNLDAEDCFSLASIEHDANETWHNYIRGVASVLRAEGHALCGFDGVIHSTVPIGSGLSSSAALECATAVVFQRLGAWDLPLEKMAKLCQRAENQFVGVNCGILDQFSSCLGREKCSLLLDCSDLSTGPVPIADGIQVVICDTRSRRELLGGEYGLRRKQCEDGASILGLGVLRDATAELLEEHANELPPDVLKRCRFIVAENARVLRMAEALSAGNRPAIFHLCTESFAGARDLFEICSAPMLKMMQAMLAAPGIIGARQAGGGFGGCMVAFVETGRTKDFTSAVCKSYSSAAGRQAEIYPVEAAAGAGVIDFRAQL